MQEPFCLYFAVAMLIYSLALQHAPCCSHKEFRVASQLIMCRYSAVGPCSDQKFLKQSLHRWPLRSLSCHSPFRPGQYGPSSSSTCKSANLFLRPSYRSRSNRRVPTGKKRSLRLASKPTASWHRQKPCLATRMSTMWRLRVPGGRIECNKQDRLLQGRCCMISPSTLWAGTCWLQGSWHLAWLRSSGDHWPRELRVSRLSCQTDTSQLDACVLTFIACTISNARSPA